MEACRPGGGELVPAGVWAKVRREIFRPEQRVSGLPADTRVPPYVGWSKGFMIGPAVVGDEVTVRTLAGRLVAGTLVEVNPAYGPGFCRLSPVLVRVGSELRELLREKS